MTIAGWYPDPDGSRRLRYWDGERWTDHTAVPADAPSPGAPPSARPGWTPGPPMSGPPPTSGPSPWAAEPTVPSAPPSAPSAPSAPWVPGATAGPAAAPWTPPARTSWRAAPLLPPVGAWFSATFRTVGARRRALAVATVLALLPALLCAVALVVAASTGDARFVDADDVDDANSTMVAPIEGDDLVRFLAAATSLLGLLSYFLVIGAVAHQVRAHLVGRDASPGSSLRWGVRRLPRLLGWTILGVLAAAVLLFVAIVPAAFSVAFLVITLPAALGVLIWAGVRLVFVPEVVALADPHGGEGVVQTSWRLSRDRWWGLLGRTLLMALAVGVPASLVSLPLTGIGQAADSVPTWAVGQLVATIANGVSTTITAVSTVLLYAWVDGPVDPDADA